MNLIKKKGFTLIETIITAGILLITLALISPLLNYNLKSLYTTENKNDLQREANKSLEDLTKKAMEAINISFINDRLGHDALKDTISEDGISISEIEFSTGVSNDNPENYINYNFKLNQDGSLTYRKKVLKKNSNNGSSTLTVVSTSSRDIATNINSIKLKPSSGTTFEKCDGIRIQFEFSKRLVKPNYLVTSEVKFRNK